MTKKPGKNAKKPENPWVERPQREGILVALRTLSRQGGGGGTSQAAVARWIGREHGGFIRLAMQRLVREGLVLHTEGEWFDYRLSPAGEGAADALIASRPVPPAAPAKPDGTF